MKDIVESCCRIVGFYGGIKSDFKDCGEMEKYWYYLIDWKILKSI